MSVCTSNEFATIRDHMIAVCPPPERHTIEIVRMAPEDMAGNAGTCEKKGRKFRIEICRSLSYRETIDVMTHEVAHMMDWRPYSAHGEDHGATWGVWYARTYQAYNHTR